MTDNQQNFPPPSAPELSPQTPPAQPAQAPAPHQAPTSPMPPMAVAPRRGGFARGFGGGFGFGLGLGAMMLAITLVSTIGMIVAIATAAPSATSTNVSTIWGSGTGTLRAVNVTGTILSDTSDGAVLSAGTYGNEIAKQIDGLNEDDAAGLILLVNTPGGSIGGSKAISDSVERYQERTGQPVLVHISSMSASGGVYATASADEIISDYGTLVGSIGVIFGPFTHYDGVIATSGSLLESGVTTTGGITQEYLTAGTAKDFGNPFREITDAERANYTEFLDVEYDNFVSHVSTHRGIPEDTVVNELGAFMFDAETAVEKGLVDNVMGRDDFFRYAAENAGLDPDDTRVEAVRSPSAWESLLGVERAHGVAPAVEQGAGVVPTVSQAFCGGGQPLVFAGDLASVCG